MLLSRSYINEKLPGTWIGSRGKVWNGLLKAPLLARSISSFGALWMMMYMLRNLQIYPSLVISIRREAQKIGNDIELLKKVCLSATNPSVSFEQSCRISRFDDFGMLCNCCVLLKICRVIQPIVFHMKAHSSDNNPEILWTNRQNLFIL